MNFKEVVSHLAYLMSLKEYDGTDFLATYKQLEQIIIRNYNMSDDKNKRILKMGND